MDQAGDDDSNARHRRGVAPGPLAVTVSDSASLLRASAAAVLADPMFSRAPQIARLLTYLVDRTLQGDAGTLKSYTVATEGLGKFDHSGSADAYARVQVGRLRRALDQHYERCGVPEGLGRLTLAPRRYEVLVEERSRVPASQPDTAVEASPGRLRAMPTLVVAALVFVLLALAGLAVFLLHEPASGGETWRHSNFPSVSVAVEGGDPEARRAAQDEALLELRRYEGLRIFISPQEPTDFQLRLKLGAQGTDGLESITFLDQRNRRLVWFSDGRVRPGIDPVPEAYLPASVFEVASAVGALHSYSRRIGYRTDSPYGCWLRFIERLQVLGTAGDAELTGCAAAWYANAPEHPVAAMLRGWTLTDQANARLLMGRRESGLEEAASLLNDAIARSPGSVPLHLAAMRTYAFEGSTENVWSFGTAALQLNPHSAEVKASVGLLFTLMAIDQGQPLLTDANRSGPYDIKWHHVGLAVSAMMNDDPAQVGHEIAAFEEMAGSNPMLAVLRAAYLRRIGRGGEAGQVLHAAGLDTHLLSLSTEDVIERTPTSGEVRRRLRQWLEWPVKPVAAAKASAGAKHR